MNSRAKGKRGERAWRDELRANGYQARRGQQFSGSPDSPDVVCDDLAAFHFEVKVVERLNIYDAMAQALRDAHGGVRSPSGPSAGRVRSPSGPRPQGPQLSPKTAVVAHKRNFGQWLVTMEAETFFRLLRGDFLIGPQTEVLSPISNFLSPISEPSHRSPESHQSHPSTTSDFGPRTSPTAHFLRPLRPVINQQQTNNRKNKTDE